MTASKAKRPVIFKHFRRSTCPDCIERGSLDGRLLGSRPKDYCETCNSQGRATFCEVVGSWPPKDPWVWRGGR